MITNNRGLWSLWLCLFVAVLAILQISTQAQTAKARSNDATVRCKKVKHSSKRKVSGSLLCGPPKRVSNETTALGPNTVELRVLIDENGKITSVNPVLGDPALYDTAVNAVNKMKFQPKQISGRAVKTELSLRIVVNTKTK